MAREFSAVICELNPLHQGHRFLFDAARRRSAGLVCILSGNFVQRGEPAVVDKWARTRMALQAGADLVVELPLPWACAGAERFAAGGAALAAGLPDVGALVFGSEVPDPALITQVAEALLSPGFPAALSALPDDGSPFARRRQQAIAALLGDGPASLLAYPNATLAVEYTKAILSQGLPLEIRPIPRTGAAHDAPAAPGETPSASQLRALLAAGQSLSGLVPPQAWEIIQHEQTQNRCPAALSRLEPAILACLRTMSPADFAALPDISEGLENRLYKAARQAATLPEFYALAKTKRYSHARLRRLALAAFLQIPQSLPSTPPYLHILGLTPRAAPLLKSCTLPILARPSDLSRLPPSAQSLYALESRADDLYALSTPRPQPCGRTLRQGIIKG